MILFKSHYSEILRGVYSDIPETVDFVMYWWHKAATLINSKKLINFGFITTNTIWQIWQRKIIDFHLQHKNPIKIFFAISDHPWTDEGADVRIAMTASILDDTQNSMMTSKLGILISEGKGTTPEESAERIEITWRKAAKIFSNLQVGADVASARPLKGNLKICCPGVKLHGMGFCLNKEEASRLESEVIYPYLNGRDIAQTSRDAMVIDLFGYSEQEVATKYPKIYSTFLIHEVQITFAKSVF